MACTASACTLEWLLQLLAEGAAAALTVHAWAAPPSALVTHTLWITKIKQKTRDRQGAGGLQMLAHQGGGGGVDCGLHL